MRTYLQQLRWGTFNLIEGDLISNIAAQFGEWSPVEVTLFQHLLHPASNVIEVGANIGLHSVPLANMIPQGKLICFEPQRIIFQQLCCNLALNNLTNVETYRKGVSNQAGTHWIEDSDYSEAWNYGSFSLDKGFSTESDFTGVVNKSEIDIVKLDDFAPVQRLNTLDLLKIDAEGFDIPVLAGAVNTIARLRPKIFIEVHAHSVDNTLAAIHSLGYRAFWIHSLRYQADNFKGLAVDNPEAFGADINFLCTPPEKITFENQLIEATSVQQLLNDEVPFLQHG